MWKGPEEDIGELRRKLVCLPHPASHAPHVHGTSAQDKRATGLRARPVCAGGAPRTVGERQLYRDLCEEQLAAGSARLRDAGWSPTRGNPSDSALNLTQLPASSA